MTDEVLQSKQYGQPPLKLSPASLFSIILARRMIDLSQQPCQVCGATCSALLWTTTWPEHRYPGEFSMRRCDSCGLLFNSPRLDDQQLSRLYGSNYYFFNRPDARELARIVPMYQRTVGMIADAIPQKRMLDIGSGRGYFPAVLRRLGWEARGVELSDDAARYARERFGIEIFTGTVEQFAASARAPQFPLVTAIDVIEHVPSPRSFVKAIAQVTAAGGHVIIDTPNADAQNIQTRRIEWPGFNPFHIFLFTIGNLTKLLESHGLRVEKSFSYNNQPRNRSVRDIVVRTLRKSGLLGPVARSFFRLKAFAKTNDAEINRLVDAAGQRIRASASWDQTADAGAPFASNSRGDNIIVIARRS